MIQWSYYTNLQKSYVSYLKLCAGYEIKGATQ